MRKIIIAFLIIILISGILILFPTNKYTVSGVEIVERIVEVKVGQEEVLQGRITELQNDVLDQLSLGCETKGIKEPDAAIILDTNNKMSIGRYMYQITTVQYYYQKIYDEEITRVEAIQIAIDKERATELTRAILFTQKGGAKNWFICSKKLNLESQINLINKI